MYKFCMLIFLVLSPHLSLQNQSVIEKKKRAIAYKSCTISFLKNIQKVKNSDRSKILKLLNKMILPLSFYDFY